MWYLCTSDLRWVDRAGPMIDNSTGFESLNLETGTVAEGVDGELWRHLFVCVCVCWNIGKNIWTGNWGPVWGGVGCWEAMGVVRGRQLQTYACWQAVERWIAVGQFQRSIFIQSSFLHQVFLEHLGDLLVKEREEEEEKEVGLASCWLHPAPLCQICLGSQTLSYFGCTVFHDKDYQFVFWQVDTANNW